MPEKKYDFFLPVSLTIDEYDDLQKILAELKSYWTAKGSPNFNLSDLVYLGAWMYYDTYIEPQAEPAPYLDNIETS